MHCMRVVDPIPHGARLFHIGPHKTATTAIQSALHAARDTLPALGAAYPQATLQAYAAAVALNGHPGHVGGRTVVPGDWDDLVARLEAAGDLRAAVSSESFSVAKRPAIERLVRDVGPERVHVVRMVRRLDKLVTSQFQQRVVAGNRRTFEQWFAEEIEPDDSPFWRRQGYTSLTQRWADVVGPDRVQVVVVDERDPMWLMRVFDGYLGLPEGTLVPPATGANRSLSWGETEMLRRFNVAFTRRGWEPKSQFRFIRHGVSRVIKEVPDDEAVRLSLPPRFADHLAERANREVDGLIASGFAVVGDPEPLRHLSPVPTTPLGDPTVAPDAVAASVERILLRARADSYHVAELPPVVATPEPAEASTHAVVAVGPAGDLARRLVVEPNPRGGLLARVRRPRVALWVPPVEQVLLGGWQQALTERRDVSWQEWLDADGTSWLDRHIADLRARSTTARLERVVDGDAWLPSVSLGVDLTFPTASPDRVRRSLLTPAELAVLRRLVRRWAADALSDAEWQRYVLDGAVDRLLSHEVENAAVPDLSGAPSLAPGLSALEDWYRGVGATRPTPAVQAPDERVPARTAGVFVIGAVAATDPRLG